MWGNDNYLRNGLKMWKMTQRFGIWIHGALLKYLKIGLTMLEMTYIFGNWLKCLRNGQNMWGIDVDLWEMSQICGKMT